MNKIEIHYVWIAAFMVHTGFKRLKFIVMEYNWEFSKTGGSAQLRCLIGRIEAQRTISVLLLTYQSRPSSWKWIVSTWVMISTSFQPPVRKKVPRMSCTSSSRNLSKRQWGRIWRNTLVWYSYGIKITEYVPSLTCVSYLLLYIPTSPAASERT